MKALVIYLLLVFALGLASAVPMQFPYVFPLETSEGFQGGEQNHENAEHQVIPAVVGTLTKVIPPILSVGKSVARNLVCRKDEASQLQEYTDNEERDAQIMAIIKVMDDILAVKEKLNKVKQLNMIMKGNRVAEAELLDWVDSIGETLGNVYDKLKTTAKRLLCQ